MKTKGPKKRESKEKDIVKQRLCSTIKMVLKKEDPKKKTSSRNRSTRASNTLTHCPNDWTHDPQPNSVQYASSAKMHKHQ